MGFLDFLTKPIDPEKGSNQDYNIFLAERGVKRQSWNYDYTAAYEDYKKTGIDPYDPKSKHWVSTFKHPLSEERYIQDEETKKWFDTIKDKFVSEEAVAQQAIERLEYLEGMPLDEKR
jgi:hypothetical protein